MGRLRNVLDSDTLIPVGVVVLVVYYGIRGAFYLAGFESRVSAAEGEVIEMKADRAEYTKEAKTINKRLRRIEYKLGIPDAEP